MNAAELYESEPNERRKLAREHRDVSTSHEYYALVSLHNLCSCRIRRIKCGRVQYLNFFNGEERRACTSKLTSKDASPHRPCWKRSFPECPALYRVSLKRSWCFIARRYKRRAGLAERGKMMRKT